LAQSENAIHKPSPGKRMESIQKRGSYWHAQAHNMQYLPQSRTFDTKSKAWVRAIGSEMDRGIFLDRSEAERTSLREVLDRYVREIVAKKSRPYKEQWRILRRKAHPLPAVRIPSNSNQSAGL
jgi:Arc/MetJ-type ribon-helix-helix transcriptional regulator